ncbi:alkaline phosphatase family protein [Verrucomicrobiaceae bacterium N1E253]|uniref:Alkaline phosphatase family protein n=1 Tax=Oceaniferula marina TaxID=2748318 RepID=A0A851GIV1_9BACT|nr:alkaline phosphatase D family protein [Oceaniferula marina]NWK54144.1 alkaline phosphatase family protein [Oceaniferula marina]
MKFRTTILSILFVCLCHGQTDVHHEGKVSTIAFGSCNNPRLKTKPLFDTIAGVDPDVFIFLGDNIYGDTEDMEVLKKKYAELEAVEGYRQLRDQTVVLATWDDHDYGVNDGGKNYPMKKESEKLFLDFFNEPHDSARRKRKGVYASYTFGPVGSRCQVLLLDTRYFRDPLPKVPKKDRKGSAAGWYRPTRDTDKELLGEKQWKWLEQQLQVPADVRIIASSIQVLAHEKGMENWGNVPHEQKRLFELLKKYKANHTFAISGDVHFAELSKMDLGTYPFYDLTSSGLTHSHTAWAKMENSFRLGKAFAGQNAGVIEIDWENKSLSFNILNRQAQRVIQHQVPFSELQFK